jgi:hypothetical protein
MTNFAPSGRSVVLTYADDSTETSTLAGGAVNWLVFNPDAANVVAVNYSFNALDTNASIPTSGANGVGTIIGPASTVMLKIDSTYRTGSIYVSAAGDSSTGSVFVTPGVI